MKPKAWKDLFRVFFKIGAFTFGGGYAMIPLIKREVVEEKKWLSDKEMLDLIAIAESTPGPLAINSATFVGSRVAGVPGAAAATLGVILPSFFLILAISHILAQVQHFKMVEDAFEGIRAGVPVLIASALLSLYRQAEKNAFTYAVLIPAFLLACFFQVSSILILLLCALAGILFQRRDASGAGKEEDS